MFLCLLSKTNLLFFSLCQTVCLSGSETALPPSTGCPRHYTQPVCLQLDSCLRGKLISHFASVKEMLQTFVCLSSPDQEENCVFLFLFLPLSHCVSMLYPYLPQKKVVPHYIHIRSLCGSIIGRHFLKWHHVGDLHRTSDIGC